MSTIDPATEVRELVAREGTTSGDGASITGWLQRMCRVAVRDLPASGVGLSLFSADGVVMTAAASDDTSVVVEELQFTLGGGPCIAAYSSRRPVLVPDLDRVEASRWPGYPTAVLEHGVRAVFAFPLLQGRETIGALDVYRQRTGDLSQPELARALTYAEVATESLLEASEHADGVDSLLSEGAATRFEVYQAQGMLMIQLGVGADEALSRLRAHAFASGRRLIDVAVDVINRKLEIETDDRDRQ